jgi:hypothetical protein
MTNGRMEHGLDRGSVYIGRATIRRRASTSRKGQGVTDEGWVAASELGDWAYCERAWWFARRRVSTLAAPALERGAAQHDTVARVARQVERRQRLSVVLLLAGLALALLLGALLLTGG